ncbi:MAG: sulfur carrier protein ThiS [Nitrospirota bacterium]
MRVTINGEAQETAATTVAGLLRELKVAPERVAVEVNLTIVKRADFEQYTLNEGDTVEIVNFVGGGGAWEMHWLSRV